jgi:hypothetical protein
MTADEIDRLIRKTPFAPYRLTLANGDTVTVRKPRKANVSGDILAVSGITRRRQNGVGVSGLNLIRVSDIIAIEDAVGDGATT